MKPKRKIVYYVTMTDKFMSGWGMASGKKNKFIVTTKTRKQAQTIKRNAKRRPEMKYINITTNKPSYNKKNYYISKRKYKDLGRIWKRK